jgi:hypothetical protein
LFFFATDIESKLERLSTASLAWKSNGKAEVYPPNGWVLALAFSSNMEHGSVQLASLY